MSRIRNEGRLFRLSTHNKSSNRANMSVRPTIRNYRTSGRSKHTQNTYERNRWTGRKTVNPRPGKGFDTRRHSGTKFSLRPQGEPLPLLSRGVPFPQRREVMVRGGGRMQGLNEVRKQSILAVEHDSIRGD